MSLSTIVLAGQALSAGGTKQQTGYVVTPAATPGAVIAGVAQQDADTGTPGAGEDPELLSLGFYAPSDQTWTPARDVWIAEDGGLTQAPDFTGCSAYRRFGVVVDRATVLIAGQFNIPRAGADPRPLMISDACPFPHQATDAELAQLAAAIAPYLAAILAGG